MLATLSACAQGDERTAAQPRPTASASTATAVFAGGCFWCMEPPYDKLPGVLFTTSGYIGGHVANPTYRQVTTGRTGHTEALQVQYDPSRVNYAQLLEVFWRNIDPIAVDRQFCDVGSQYRSEIFPADPEQKKLAEASRQTIAKRLKQPIATKITEATTFYPAELYHQDYYKKNPTQYKLYRWNCGRDKRLKELWG
ncbi:MAG: peptide-methionine (S)-S-oxide reductase MsrA [Lysobacter sp.]|nr:peptide-methionine (S)-S-oxide reductase MsrA [Lysobacter sp.]